MQSQKHIEFKIAALILAYEFFSTTYLTYQGKPPPQESNVEQKLNQLNFYLRFIPRAMLDDTLRTNIRNPLFHQGAIAGADTDTLWEWYSRYYDLLVQIMFVVLGYTGQYISPHGYKLAVVPTAAANK
jgi:hypothetical protein